MLYFCCIDTTFARYEIISYRQLEIRCTNNIGAVENDELSMYL